MWEWIDKKVYNGRGFGEVAEGFSALDFLSKDSLLLFENNLYWLTTKIVWGSN